MTKELTNLKAGIEILSKYEDDGVYCCSDSMCIIVIGVTADDQTELQHLGWYGKDTASYTKQIWSFPG